MQSNDHAHIMEGFLEIEFLDDLILIPELYICNLQRMRTGSFFDSEPDTCIIAVIIAKYAYHARF